MSRFGERKKLVELTINLINEYEELASELRESIESVEVDGNYESIQIIDKYGEEDFNLSEISYYYEDEQELGLLNKAIRERLNNDEIREQFEEMNKNEFINYVGSLYYSNYRCSEIYDELKAIEEYYKENLI
ncbi:hypothetical protein [Clostridium sp.]|uniref:hypothetical protein n=1 Tax=Clostridium sp. TaxID=1506 RepID=UPI00399450A9